MNEIIPFEEIKSSPLHYIMKLIDMNDENKFILFNYGPYLAMEHPDMFLNRIEKIRGRNLRTIVAFALFEHILKEEKTPVSEIKKGIRSVINHLAKPNDQDDTIKDYGENLIESIRDYQYKNNVLESAMLGYAPIVQYAKAPVVKPEMTTDYFKNVKYDDLDEVFEKILHDNTLDIIRNYNLFISDRKDVPNYLVKLSNSTGSERIARNYFVNIFFRYTENANTYSLRVQEVFNLNSIYNKLHNGERIDVKSAVKTFESLLTPLITQDGM